MNTKFKGDVGENVCCRFLGREGFRVVARNYRKKWGELDIVALKDGGLHFFEVKSVTCGSGREFKDVHVPEENVHQLKMAKIRRMIGTFILEMGEGGDTSFTFHVVCVFLDLESRKSRIKWIRNVIL